MGPAASRIFTAFIAVVLVVSVAGDVEDVASADIGFEQIGNDIVGEVAGDESGWAVAMSADGTRVAIGAPFNSGTALEAGHVRVFEWDGAEWRQLGGDIDGASSHDEFGAGVALSSDGSRVAIMARGDRDSEGYVGYVRVLDWDGADWTEVGGDIDPDDRFDGELALSADGSMLATSGTRARVFEWDGAAWAQFGADIGTDPVDAVALSADGRRVVGGNSGSDTNGLNAGSVSVFDWDGSAWVQIGAPITGDSPHDLFGLSVAVSADGSQVAVGTSGYSQTGDAGGYVRVVGWDGARWVPKGLDLLRAAPGDGFGRGVALAADGNRVVIGAPNDFLPGSTPGYVRLAEWDGARWVPASVDVRLGADVDPAGSDLFGYSVALSGDGTRVAIGALGPERAAGLVRVVGTRFVAPTTTAAPTTTSTTVASTSPTSNPPASTTPVPAALPETGTSQRELTTAVVLLTCGLGCVYIARRRQT